MKHFESKVFDLYQNRGSLQYQGEALDQLSHGWLCAKNARISSASSALCLAAFLHDIGHLFNERETPTLEAINDRHEVRGADYLKVGFADSVTEPIRLHVQAKRYLVASTPGYLELLSEDSVRSLALQGGPMPLHERRHFEAHPYSKDAIRLRLWDEQSKQRHLVSISEKEMLSDLRLLITEVCN
jgi:predicted HD phosphohydrolase